MPDWWNLASRADELEWQPFRDGVEIHRIYGDSLTGPSAALMRFREKGSISFHHHNGYEHIHVLAGS